MHTFVRAAIAVRLFYSVLCQLLPKPDSVVCRPTTSSIETISCGLFISSCPVSTRPLGEGLTYLRRYRAIAEYQLR